MNSARRSTAVALLALAFSATAFAQWSSNPAVNLPLADDANGSDQVQPKLVPIQNNGWYVSWFDSNPSTPPPQGYDVFYQRLNSGGVEQFPHGGEMVADLTNSSTEDYGLGLDTSDNALLAFLDTREGSNQQITGATMAPHGKAVWGKLGVQLTSGSSSSNAIPKITGTSDGNVVVGWTSNSNLVLQKLNAAGQPQWGSGVVFSESGYNYTLADLHAADNGSVIVSWARAQGFGSNSQLRANKVSASGALLWGSTNVDIFDVGSLQFGNFPYFVYDGHGGAVFAWYTNSPALQCFAQHILASGAAAFPQGGAAVSSNTINVRVDPSAAYNARSHEVFCLLDGRGFQSGVPTAFTDRNSIPPARLQWGTDGLTIVSSSAPISKSSCRIVPTGSGAPTFWVDQQNFGSATIQAIKLDGTGPRFARSLRCHRRRRISLV